MTDNDVIVKVKKNPIQPIETDSHGTHRFKENCIVRKLLDEGGIDLNQISMWDVSQDDKEQFAQLLGYSCSGYSSLSFASDEVCEVARKMVEEGESEKDARIKYLEGVIETVGEGLKIAVPAVFGFHPDDMTDF